VGQLENIFDSNRIKLVEKLVFFVVLMIDDCQICFSSFRFSFHDLIQTQKRVKGEMVERKKTFLSPLRQGINTFYIPIWIAEEVLEHSSVVSHFCFDILEHDKTIKGKKGAASREKRKIRKGSANDRGR